MRSACHSIDRELRSMSQTLRRPMKRTLIPHFWHALVPRPRPGRSHSGPSWVHLFRTAQVCRPAGVDTGAAPADDPLQGQPQGSSFSPTEKSPDRLGSLERLRLRREVQRLHHQLRQEGSEARDRHRFTRFTRRHLRQLAATVLLQMTKAPNLLAKLGRFRFETS